MTELGWRPSALRRRTVSAAWMAATLAAVVGCGAAKAPVALRHDYARSHYALFRASARPAPPGVLAPTAPSGTVRFLAYRNRLGITAVAQVSQAGDRVGYCVLLRPGPLVEGNAARGLTGNCASGTSGSEPTPLIATAGPASAMIAAGLVPDGIDAVTLELANGQRRPVPVKNNAIAVRISARLLHVDWTSSSVSRSTSAE